MALTLPPVSGMPDEDLVRELLWRGRGKATGSARYRELADEHARRIREAPDRDTRDDLIKPLACGLADATRPDWVPAQSPMR